MRFWSSMWDSMRFWVGGSEDVSGTQNTSPNGTPSLPGITVPTADAALQLSAVWACVRLIAQTLASLPILVYKHKNGEFEIDESHWFAKLMLGKVNQYQTRFEFWEHMFSNLVLHGNAYALIVRLGGEIVSLRPLSPLQIETRIVDGRLVHLYTRDGKVDVLSPDDVWHLRLNNGLTVGRSPIEFGANLISIASSTENAVGSIYANGMKPSGVVSIDRLLTPDQRALIRNNFASTTTGKEDRLLILESGMKFEAVSMSPQDIELLASRRYNTEEICRWFGVPSVLVNDTAATSNWGSGIEQIVLGFQKVTLNPILDAVECSGRTHLFSDKERSKFSFEFDMEGLTRADMKARYESYRLGINAGFIKPNDARRKEGLPPVEGGEQLLVQGAMIPIGMAGTIKNLPKLGGDGGTQDATN